MNQLNTIKLKFHLGENVSYFCDEILVDSDCLEIYLVFKPKQLWYITCIFEDTSYPIFHIWENNNCKEVKDYIKKLCMCYDDFMQP